MENSTPRRNAPVPESPPSNIEFKTEIQTIDMSQNSARSDFFKTSVEQVNSQLREYLKLDERCPDLLRQAMDYSLLAPGKRIRPALVLLACQACGGETTKALPGACAVEMIHAYSLIHDDLPAMDDDDLRRGRPTCHKQFDEATAILAADALQALAFEVLAKDVHPADVSIQCVSALADAAGACGMVAGQTLDVQGEKENQTSEASSSTRNSQLATRNSQTDSEALSHLENIHRLKTGAMIRVSLIIGATIANASADQIESLKSYGDALGLLFQVTDDLLDVTATDEQMGKRTHKDSAKGKMTYPGLLGVETSQAYAAELTQKAKDALCSFGQDAELLRDLADYVLERDH